MKNWFSRKIHQLHSIMWFLGGFAFGTGLNLIGAIALLVAFALDVGISLVLSKEGTKPEQTDGDVWWTR